MDDLDTCNICMETYDGNIRPHSLPCGHTICTCCVCNSVEEGRLKCPLCQRSHAGTSVNDFPVNYNMEIIIETLKEAAISSTGANTLKSKAQAFVGEQMNTLKKLVRESQDTDADVTKYKNYLRERKSMHTEFVKQLGELIKLNGDAIKDIISEDQKLSKVLKDGENQRNEANQSMASLTDLTRIGDLEKASEELERIQKKLERWNGKCKDVFPNEKIITSSVKVAIGITASLTSNTKEDVKAGSSKSSQAYSSLSVMEKVDRIVERNYSNVLSLEKMLSPVYPMEGNMVHAVLIKDGKIRYAKVTMKKDKKYLHNLQDGEPPQGSYIVKYIDLMETLDKESVVAFLDLSWKGSIRGRVHILLSPDTPLARHFKALCSGELGPSYKNTKFLEVLNKGNSDNEFLKGGDYEKNDGEGGAPLFTGLKIDDEIYKHKPSIGSLQAAYLGNDGPRSAQFRIFTSTQVNCASSIGIFGQVQDGLDVVRDAVKLDDIKKVTITDCGIVLPL